LQRLVLASDIAALSAFLGRAWFKRVWVVQEFLLARKVRFFAGEHWMTLRSFGWSIDALLEHEQELRTKNSAIHQDVWECYLNNIELVRELIGSRSLIAPSQERTTKSLYQCCRMLFVRLCGDERDKVYAALGLARDDLGIVPDYNLSVDDICLDFAKKSVLSGDFSVLHDADTSWLDALQSSRPSFVPRLQSEHVHVRPLPLGGMDNPRYSAGLLREPAMLRARSNTIDIRGVRVDHMCYVDRLAGIVSELNVARGNPFSPRLLEAYVRAESLHKVVVGRSGGDASRVTSFKLAFWRTIHLGFCPQHEDVRCTEKANPRSVNLADWTNIARCIEDRGFFITRMGFIGIGPWWMKEHDTVVIFDGAETPMLLRPTTSDTGQELWKLVGDCYLDGWMDGKYFGFQIEDGEDRSNAKRAVAGEHRQKVPKKDEVGGNDMLKSEYFTVS
jgi:hypothetical protein